jgi:endonuclease YncB( thermonuclease family)
MKRVRTLMTWCVIAIALVYLYRDGTFETLAGRYTINDGDSLEYKGERIRLRGIDAPELNQTCEMPSGTSYDCGRDAKRALQKIIGASEISCLKTRSDKYGRKLAFCSKDKLDINAEMVRQGWAVASREFETNYLLQQTEAMDAKRGIWQGSFEQPSEYRKRNRRIDGSIMEFDD